MDPIQLLETQAQRYGRQIVDIQPFTQGSDDNGLQPDTGADNQNGLPCDPFRLIIQKATELLGRLPSAVVVDVDAYVNIADHRLADAWMIKVQELNRMAFQFNSVPAIVGHYDQGNAKVGLLAYRFMPILISHPDAGARSTLKNRSSMDAVSPPVLADVIWCSP